MNRYRLLKRLSVHLGMVVAMAGACLQPRPGWSAETPESSPSVAEGNDGPLDIKFTAVDGRQVDLAKLRGKVVLIDFWATWCGPCMGEVPHVVEAYQKYHDKGFEIVGISFDQDKAALDRVTKDKGMIWPQYFEETGSQNAYGIKYGIRGIPTMWLINRDGRVATTNARSDLAGQVAKLLGLPAERTASAAEQSQVQPHPTPRAKTASLLPSSTKLNPTTIARYDTRLESGEKNLLAHFSFDGSTPDPGADLRNVSQHDGIIDLNGEYEYRKGGGGYRAVFKTPALDYQKFTVVVRLLADDFTGSQTPLLVGGTSYRWLALSARSSGALSFSMNNSRFYEAIPGVTITPSEWVTLAVSLDLTARQAAVYVNGRNAAKIPLPADFKLDVVGSKAEMGDKVWTFANYANGTAFKGLVGELLVFGKILDDEQIRALQISEADAARTAGH